MSRGAESEASGPVATTYWKGDAGFSAVAGLRRLMVV